MGLIDKQTDLIGESYKNYLTMTEPTFIGKNISLHEYIHWIKTDEKYSEKWGLKIEERELSLLERRDIAKTTIPMGKLDPPTNWSKVIADGHYHSTYDYFNIPTKLTTINYNGQTQEIYE